MLLFSKLGGEYYKNNVDVNSGSYEADLILEKLRKNFVVHKSINHLSKHAEAVVVVSGNANFEEIEALNDECRAKGVTTILLVTDLRVAKANNLYELNFDAIFDQTPERYNYVPESFVGEFFVPFDEASMMGKKNQIIFGGNVDGRQNVVELLKVIEVDHEHFDSKLYPKPVLYTASKYKNYDGRIPYEAYKHVASKSRFSLVMSDAEYENNNFITSRFFEALDSNSIPVVNSSYDLAGICVPRDYKMIFNDASELERKLRLFNSEETFRSIVIEQLNQIKKDAIARSYKLNELINEVIDSKK